jgi:Uma2 family endonuclease
MVTQTRQQMTTAEFFELPEQSQPTELIYGELIVSPTPIPKHQNVMGNTYTVIRQISKTVGGKAFAAPLEIYLDDRVIPQPDVMWIAPDSKCIIDEKRLIGPPDLVVEIFSPGSVLYDRGDKFDIYQRYGVREYWMIDPTEEYVEVYKLADGQFVRQGIYGLGKQFTSSILSGTTIDVDKIFEW